MKQIYLIIFLSYSITISSQLNPPINPYEKVTFQNLEPKWYETSFDATMISDSCDGYNYFYNLYGDPDFLFVDDFVFTTYYLNGKQGRGTGVYIEKRNVNNGNLEWTYKYDLRDTENKVEPARLLYIQNGDLVLLSQRSEEEYPEKTLTFGLFKSYITKRIIDINTGELKEYLVANQNDDKVEFVSYYSTKFQAYNYVFKEGDNYRYFTPALVRIDTSIFYYNLSKLINDEGKLVEEIDTTYRDESQYFFNIAQISQDTYLRVQVNIKDNNLKFEFFDKNLNTYYTIYSDSISKIGYMLLQKVYGEKLLFKEFVEIPTQFNLQEYHTWFSKSGKLLGRYRVPDNVDEPHSFWHEKSQRMIFTNLNLVSKSFTEIEPVYLNLSYYDANNDSLVLLKNIFLKDSFKLWAIHNSRELENGDMLFNTSEGELYKKPNGQIEVDGNARAMSLIRISAEELGLISKTYDIVNNNINLYPNPTNSIINLEIENKTSIAEIFDTSGKLTLKTNIEYGKNTIDVSQFHSGLYFIKIVSNNLEVMYSKFIKI